MGHPHVGRRPRRRPGRLRGRAGRGAARRLGHGGRPRRPRRCLRAHRLRTEQGPHLDGRVRHGPRASGVRPQGARRVADASVDLATVNRRILDLAEAQSDDIRGAPHRRRRADRPRHGRARSGPARCGPWVSTETAEDLDADVVLLATGSTPRTMPTAQPDGERILTWQQIYSLDELPEHLVVVGSGVTGAELAHAYLGLGARVTLVSSPRPGAARRGRRRRHRHRGRVPARRHGGARPVAGGRRSSAPPTGSA